jgi:uncharacterized repeat protein (TIGR02543 family)
MMKTAYFLRSLMGLTLVLVLAAAGCDNGVTGETSYTVSFDGGDGSGTPPASKTVKEKESIDLPGKGGLTAPENKEFDGWKAGGKTYAAGDAYTVTGDITFVAQWKAASTETPAGSLTVTFNADGGSPGTASRTVASSGGTVDSLPADPTKTGSTFDGWYTEKNGAGTAFTAATKVTASITVYAKWKAANPFVGGIWLDWDLNLHYKFAEIDGKLIYYEATGTTFSAKGSYDFDPVKGELTLRPDGGDAKLRTYEITKSLMILDKEKTGATSWYTRNPETGGGFNGAEASAPLGGMWKKNSGTPSITGIDLMGFNNDGEYFSAAIKSGDGKYWWDVRGTYEYKNSELTLRPNGLGGTTTDSAIYKTEFTVADQKLTLTKSGESTPFDKDKNL